MRQRLIGYRCLRGRWRLQAQPVGRCAARHGPVGVRVVQHAHRAAAPAVQQLRQPLHQGMGVEHAAVEQHGVGQRAVGVLAQELRQVAADGGIGRVRQAKAAQRALAPGGHRIDRRGWQKAFHHPLLHLGARERGGLRLGQQLAAAAQQGDAHLLGRPGGQQLFLGHAAALHQLRKALCGQALAGAGQRGLQLVGQGQVHVVAAQHQVLAHGRAREQGQAAVGRGVDPDQGQVGGAAAHVHHQHQAAVGQLCGQLRALQQQPVVEGGLGFFEQLHLRQASQLRGLQRQRARALVERGGHRQHHALLRQRGLRVGLVPGGAHMGQVRGRGRQRRDLGHLVARAPGQNGRRAVHPGVRQPAFGAGHQPPGHGRTQLARPAADDGRCGGRGALRRPGLLPGIAQLTRGGLVAHRGQQGLGHDLARRAALREVQQGDVGRRAVHGHAGDHGVAGAQVDPDDKGCAGRGHRHAVCPFRPAAPRSRCSGRRA